MLWFSDVPSEALQDAMVLERWMQFQGCSYRTLAPHPGENCVLGGRALLRPGLHGAASFLLHYSAPFGINCVSVK